MSGILVPLTYEQYGFLTSVLEDTIGERDVRFNKVQEILIAMHTAFRKASSRDFERD